MHRFIPVGKIWSSRHNIAEFTGSCAYISKDHKSCGSMAPAFCHIGAAATLANGMQLIFQNYIFNLQELVIRAQTNL